MYPLSWPLALNAPERFLHTIHCTFPLHSTFACMIDCEHIYVPPLLFRVTVFIERKSLSKNVHGILFPFLGRVNSFYPIMKLVISYQLHSFKFSSSIDTLNIELLYWIL